MYKDDKSGSKHKSERLKIKDHTGISPSINKRRPIQCSNCKQHGHEKLRCNQVIAAANTHADKKNKKQVEKIFFHMNKLECKLY